MIGKQILLFSTLGNVQRTVWRICILMLGCKGLMTAQKEFSRLSLFPASRASLGQIYDTNQLRMMFVCVLYIFILLKTTEYYF